MWLSTVRIFPLASQEAFGALEAYHVKLKAKLFYDSHLRALERVEGSYNIFPPTPKVIPPPQETLSEQLTLITYEKTFEVLSVSRVTKTLVSEEVTLKTLEELKVDNDMVRERLDKQDEIFEAQAGTNNKIEGMLQAILSRRSPPS
ncbi:uncharacterized protein LOC127102153 [Lathyrus oleraceus]|uniref:uncharacterized protein LOC127102153 n=1 Tax=Pisum sativum TaxID=3888 RepID=UPI0021D1A494|nr:uncharacterized protein LOC127102153 [Pisum sativum]